MTCLHAFPRYDDPVYDGMLEATLRRNLSVFWEEMLDVWASQGYVLEPVPAPVEIVRSDHCVEDTEMPEIAAESDSASLTDIVTEVDVESDLATSGGFSVFETVDSTLLSLPEMAEVPRLLEVSLSLDPFQNDSENCVLLRPVVVYMYILLISLMKYTFILLLLVAPVLWYCFEMRRVITALRDVFLSSAVSVLVSNCFNALRLGVIYCGEMTKKAKAKKDFLGSEISAPSLRDGAPADTVSFMSAPWKVGIKGRYKW